MTPRTNFFYSCLILVEICSFLIVRGQSKINKNGFDLSDSLIPIKEIHLGGPPRDGIPAIDHPLFRLTKDVRLDEDDRVLGVEINNIAKAYPISILNYHEIVNDKFGQLPVFISYCPLCGSGIAFNADFKGKRKTFGVSGLLYNSDVLLYDRETESLWSQILGQAISGPEKSKQLTAIPTIHTTWGKWKAMYPKTYVLSTKTGFNRDYTSTPYKGYDKHKRLYFPVANKDKTFHPKEWVIGIVIDRQPKAYPFSILTQIDTSILEDEVGSKNIFISFDKESRSAIIRDEQDNVLDGVTMYWFAWYAFHPQTEVFAFE